MENQEKPVRQDEIELGHMFSKFGEFLGNLGRQAVRLLALVRRTPIENKIVFGVVIGLSIILTYSYGTFLKKSFYESSMIISSNYLNKRLVENSINKLQLLANESDKSGLAKALNIDPEIAQNISGFRSKPFVDEKDIIELEVLKEQLKSLQQNNPKNVAVIDQVVKRIEIENRHAFEITVRTYSPAVIGSLETALLNYFGSSAYIKKRIEITRQNLLAKKDKLVRESLKLDSLKRVIYSNYEKFAKESRQGSNNVILSDRAGTDPIEIYTKDILFYEDIQSIERQLYLQQDFELVTGFTEFNEPASASLVKMLAQALLVGIGISYLLVALAKLNRYLATVDKDA